MIKLSRVPFLCILTTLVLAAVWLLCATLVVPPLIERVYHGESLPIFNRIIAGQAVHPVARYLMIWKWITYCGLVIILVVFLFEEAHVRAWAYRYAPLPVALVILIHLIPLWTFTYFPSLDGPVHLNIANVLRKYTTPDLPVFREYYVLNTHFDPNWMTYVILVPLMSLVSPLTAEKIFLSSYVILLPLSTFYALRAIHPTAGLLTLVVSPFIYNRLLHMGFYNFSYSLPMFFFVLGYWLRHRDRFTPSRTAILALLSLLLYFCHLVSLIMAYTFIIFLALLPVLRELAQHVHRRHMDFAGLWCACRTQLLPSIYAFVPTLMLALLFLGRQGMTGRSADSAWHGLQRLLNLFVLTSYDSLEVWPIRLLVVLLFLVSCSLLASKVVHRRFAQWDILLLVILVYTGMYFVAPNEMAGGSVITPRLSLYPFFALLLWIGGQSLSEKGVWRMSIAVTGIALMLLRLHTMAYATLNDYLEEYLSGMHLVAPNTTLLTLDFSRNTVPHLSPSISPFVNASGYIAAQRNIVTFANYQPTTGYFPIVFRPNLTPPLHIAIQQERRNKSPLEAGSDALAHEPPLVDFLTYPQRTGGRVDYVLVWNVRPEQRDLAATDAIFSQLQAHYELIYTSPQRGLMQLYRWKDEKQDAPLSTPSPSDMDKPN